MHKVCKICKNVQWPHKYFSYAFICIYMHKICKQKKSKICKHENHMQHMQKYALPTLLMVCWVRWRCWRCFTLCHHDAAVPRFQRSRAAEERVLHCFSGLRVNSSKVLFSKLESTRSGPPSLASARPWVTCSGQPSLVAARVTRPAVHHPPLPASLAAARVTQVTEWVADSVTHRRLTGSATRRPSRCLRDSQRPESFAQPVQLATARFSCPSSIAATRVTHSGGLRLQSTTLQRPPHSPQPESLAWLSQWLTQWLAAAQWLATAVAPKRMSVSLLWILGSGFWNTLIAIFGASLSQCHVHSQINSYMNSLY